jgi:hypothetical protein
VTDPSSRQRRRPTTNITVTADPTDVKSGHEPHERLDAKKDSLTDRLSVVK